jgi:4-amino-4-deoxy-L-arabinose transferase-like glycosyltransferase
MTAAAHNALRGLLAFAALVLLAFVYREWVTVATPIHLFYDEAYYLSWAQSPDWGYYSKPPMVAWLIALSTALFGNAEWAVKLAAPVLYGLSALLVYQTARGLFGARAAVYSGVIFLFMPLVSFNSLFITTDAPLLFFWAAATWALVRALDTDQWRWWLLAGVCGGLGLLSKYTFILFPLGLLGFALFSSRGRALLSNGRFWSACLLALALLLPNLWWNYQHDFISFQHTAEISQLDESRLNLVKLGEFLAGQLLVFGPVFFVLLISAQFRQRPFSDAEILLWNLFWPTLIVIGLQALLARAHVNWAAAAYVSASLLAGYYLSRQPSRRWLGIGLAINLLFMVALYHYEFFTSQLGIERKHGTTPYKRITGWAELVQSFQPWFERYPDHKLASDSRKLLAYFGYYLTPQDFSGEALNLDSAIDDHYELSHPIGSGGHHNYLFITQRLTAAELQQYFSQVELITERQVQVYSNLTRSARLYRLDGFKGNPADE